MTQPSAVETLAGFGLSPDSDPVPAPLPADFIAQWPAQGILVLEGSDARTFLQGQVTCQIDDLSPRQSLLGAACTPKGKALANFRLVETGNGEILLRLSAELASPMLNHFQKYLAFYKSSMNASHDWCLLGLSGERAIAALGIAERPAPGTVMAWGSSYLVATQADSTGPRFELWLHRDDSERLKAIDSGLFAPQAAWLASEIRAGLTTIDEPLRDRYVPQFFNWHILEGISFRKGCYTGQEIVARMHYLGQLKKSTYRITLPKGGATPLAVVTDGDGRSVGEVTNLVNLTDGSQEALAVINHVAARGKLTLADAGDRPVRLELLPYRVPEQSTETGG